LKNGKGVRTYLKTGNNTFDAVKLEESPVFTVGTLVYSRSGLVVLFSWLLWGDFVFTLMYNTMPSLLPLLLKGHGATNQQISFFTSGIAMLANTIMNPIISYRSDRYRSRWGRRRPFIIWTMPFVVLFMAAVPFAPDILAWISHSSIVSRLLGYSPISPLILIFGCLVGGFQIFNIFVSSVYYYLIPDVVPQPLLGRFYALFRVFGSLAGLVFNYFLYGLADNHMQAMFVGIAVFYGIMITVVCCRVKEGEYPPLEQEERGHWWSGAKNYARECFGQSYFWLVFLTYSCVIWSSNIGITFMVFFYRDEIGFSLDSFGKLMAAGNVLTTLLIYPMGVLLDRWGSQKSLIVGQMTMAIVSILAFLTIHGKWIGSFWAIILLACISFQTIAILKWTVDLYPRERYGQFGSAGAMFSSFGSVFLSLLCGAIMDWFGTYRCFWLWFTFFTLFGAIMAWIVYRKHAVRDTAEPCNI
jgi:MFS family permease